MIDPVSNNVRLDSIETFSSGPLVHNEVQEIRRNVQNYARPLQPKLMQPVTKRPALQVCRPPKQPLRLPQLPRDPATISLSSPYEKFHGIIKSEKLHESTTVQEAMSYMKGGIPNSARQQAPPPARTYTVKQTDDRLMQILHNAEIEQKRELLHDRKPIPTAPPPKYTSRLVAPTRPKNLTVSRQFAVQNGVSQRQFAYVHANQEIQEDGFEERLSPQHSGTITVNGEKLVRDEETTHGVVTSFNSRAIVRIKSTEYSKRDDFGNIAGLGENEEDEHWISHVDVSEFQGISNELMNSSRPLPIKQEKPRYLDEFYPKPTWSYSSLIALALKNSNSGQLTVAEIYAFIIDNFPYFRTAPPGWKNSVRHNLSLNKCFQKVEADASHQQRKSCLWMICPSKIDKLEADIKKSTEKGFVDGLENPDDLAAIESGTKGMPDMDHYMKSVLKASYTDNVRARVESNKYHEMSKQSSSLMKNRVRVNQSPMHPTDHFDASSHEVTLSAIASIEDDVATSSPFHVDEVYYENTQSSSNLNGKRPFSEVLHSPVRTPPRTPEPDLFNVFETNSMFSTREDGPLSPVRYMMCGGSFDLVREALNDNSLMSAALEESPYKGPVTFPVLS